MKIVKYFKNTGLIIKGVSESVKNKAKEENGGFFGMLSGTLGASLLGNLLKAMERNGQTYLDKE